jgi:hypothetical protein
MLVAVAVVKVLTVVRQVQGAQEVVAQVQKMLLERQAQPTQAEAAEAAKAIQRVQQAVLA